MNFPGGVGSDDTASVYDWAGGREEELSDFRLFWTFCLPLSFGAGAGASGGGGIRKCILTWWRELVRLRTANVCFSTVSSRAIIAVWLVLGERSRGKPCDE